MKSDIAITVTAHTYMPHPLICLNLINNGPEDLNINRLLINAQLLMTKGKSDVYDLLVQKQKITNK